MVFKKFATILVLLTLGALLCTVAQGAESSRAFTNSAGQVVYRVHYNAKGQEDLATRYSAKGEVIQQLHFAGGVLDGEATEWWPESGHLKEQKTYRKGRLHGVRKRWAYDPRVRKDCNDENEQCWAGSQECWIDGERRPHEACSGDVYAATGLAQRRALASGNH